MSPQRSRRALALACTLAACRPEPAARAAPRSAAPAASAEREPAPTERPARAAVEAAPSPDERAGVRAGAVEFRTDEAAPRAGLVPWLVALHGLGDRPEAFAPLLRGLRTPAQVLVLRAPRPWQGGYSWFAPRALTDHAAWVAGLRAAATTLDAWLAAPEQRAARCGAPVVTGFSQGGMLSLALAARGAALAAAVPVAGSLPDELLPAAGSLRDRALPVTLLHGEADERVPFADGARTLAALERAGLRTELRRYPGLEHTISPRERVELLATLDAALARACPTP